MSVKKQVTLRVTWDGLNEQEAKMLQTRLSNIRLDDLLNVLKHEPIFLATADLSYLNVRMSIATVIYE